MESSDRITRYKDIAAHLDVEEFEASEGRPDDIEVNGRLLSTIEKTPLQKEAVEHAMGFIEEHMRELGLEPRRFDERRVTYLDYVSSQRGAWNKRDDWIILATYTEANVHVLDHELLHAVAADWMNTPHEEVEARQGIRDAKTGFSTVWRDKKAAEDAPQFKTNFLLFNEAVTEKMAHEITTKHKEYAESLPKAHMDRYEEHMRRAQEYIDNGLAEDMRIFEQKCALIEYNKNASIAEERRRADERLRELENEDLDDEVREFEKKEIQELLEHAIKNAEGLATYFTNSESRAIDIYKEIRQQQTTKQIEDAWLKPTETVAYQEGISILDLLLDGVATYESKHTGEAFDTARQRIWQDLQRAYFSGNTMWFRKIGRVFGPGTVRAVGILQPDPLAHSEGADAVIEGLKKRVAELKQ